MLSNLTEQAWDQKVVDLGGSILQSWVWGEFQAALGFKIHRFSGPDFVNLAIETPLIIGKKYLYSPRGPLGDVEAGLVDPQKLSETDSDIVFARVEPNVPLSLPRAVKDVQPAVNWMLDVEKREEDLLINMKPKHRYNINLAQRRGVVVREGNKEDLLIFWKLLLETAGRNKFKLHPQNYYWQLWEKLGPEHAKLLIAEYQGKPLSGVLLTIFSDTVTYLHGGSSAANKDVMAPYLLHWEGIKLAKRLGMKNYDFGGVSSDPRHHWAGITRFKKGFGGFEVAYPGAFDLVFAPMWYQAYKQARLLRKIIR
ncbi:MAG: peptidoglycan bridge formation glycyltransferase FemA/FemB family protein [Candidatus Doudnabacteria bacterium]|nr:peptidoglycan bridge formation glycyltransferase FemA/FemB family protein [Candidatus Doudnabacteria bacterium]